MYFEYSFSELRDKIYADVESVPYLSSTVFLKTVDKVGTIL